MYLSQFRGLCVGCIANVIGMIRLFWVFLNEKVENIYFENYFMNLVDMLSFLIITCLKLPRFLFHTQYR